jgi:hypothetical protein
LKACFLLCKKRLFACYGQTFPKLFLHNATRPPFNYKPFLLGSPFLIRLILSPSKRLLYKGVLIAPVQNKSPCVPLYKPLYIHTPIYSPLYTPYPHSTTPQHRHTPTHSTGIGTGTPTPTPHTRSTHDTHDHNSTHVIQ